MRRPGLRPESRLRRDFGAAVFQAAVFQVAATFRLRSKAGMTSESNTPRLKNGTATIWMLVNIVNF